MTPIFGLLTLIAPLQAALPPLPREAFNRLAAAQGVPLLWRDDTNKDGLLQPAEMLVLGLGADRGRWVAGDKLTPAFDAAYAGLQEAYRQELVARELSAARPTPVEIDLTGLSATEKEFVRHILRAGELVDQLYGLQTGAWFHAGRLGEMDPASRALFQRNHGPWCEAPATGANPYCSALPDFPARKEGMWPSEVNQDMAFCEGVGKLPDASQLLDPFTVVRKKGDQLVALPLHDVFGPEMDAVARELRTGAQILEGTSEKALVNYLNVAATAFETGSWFAADQAWADMKSANSKWYLRAAPDETYWDVCGVKSGFGLTFARTDAKALVWKEKLTPLKGELEGSFARLIGPAYKARDVKFDMPDFIEVILYAGESRSALGATLGQSLPNFGPVAAAGGRTMVMTNIRTDPDSMRALKARAEVLLTKKSQEYFSEDNAPENLSTLLHEATHNLGPTRALLVNGKNPDELFGGPLSSTLEELKAQTGALYYVDLLRKKGVIDEKFARESYTRAILWTFRHISRGMVDADGNRKPYSQLAAVHVGFLTQEGALKWVEEKGADGKTVSRFHIDYNKMPAAVEKLYARVGKVLANGDVKGGAELIDSYVKGANKGFVHMEEITDRVGKDPDITMVFSVGL